MGQESCNIESPEDTFWLNDATDQPNVSAAALNLGLLADNRGPTLTHLPLTGSVAIDQIPGADCVDGDGVPITTDQRGTARPLGTACDIGSVEDGGDVSLAIDLSSMTFVLEGAHVPYTVTVGNTMGQMAPVTVVSRIEQGAPVRPGGGTHLRCGGVPDGELPLGTCIFDYTTIVSNGFPGDGTLVPGAATARFELKLCDPGTGAFIELLDQVTIPVTLVAPVECPCFSEAEIEYNRATFEHADAECWNEDSGWRLFAPLRSAGSDWRSIHPVDRGRCLLSRAFG